jgi:hypothetical protein
MTALKDRSLLVFAAGSKDGIEKGIYYVLAGSPASLPLNITY